MVVIIYYKSYPWINVSQKRILVHIGVDGHLQLFLTVHFTSKVYSPFAAICPLSPSFLVTGN